MHVVRTYFWGKFTRFNFNQKSFCINIELVIIIKIP